MLKLILTYGGWVLIPLAALSLTALAVAIERCWRLLPLRKRLQAQRHQLLDVMLREGASSAVAAIDQTSPVARIARAGLHAQTRGVELVRLATLDAAQREVTACERGLGVLLATTQIAPLLGLLGTVIGLVEAFQAASVAEQINSKLLSGGIYKALSTTVAGLLVAIPAFMAYSTLNGVVARITDELEQTATDLPLALK